MRTKFLTPNNLQESPDFSLMKQLIVATASRDRTPLIRGLWPVLH